MHLFYIGGVVSNQISPLTSSCGNKWFHKILLKENLSAVRLSTMTVSKALCLESFMCNSNLWIGLGLILMYCSLWYALFNKPTFQTLNQAICIHANHSPMWK